MKGERKLRLVTGGGGTSPAPDLPPLEASFTDEERAAAAALREALDRPEGQPTAPGDGGAALLAAELRAAYAPAPLGTDDLSALVERALGDDAAATDLERAAGERLRAELAGEAAGTAETELLRALKAATRPVDLAAAEHEALIEAALRAPPRAGSRSPRRIAPVTMVALAGVAALAAGVALFVGRVDHDPAALRDAQSYGAALVPARSADDLFDATVPFPRRGGESARIDRIASARAADLRNNRFAAWRVK